jgi:hypothetical protein
MSKTETMGNFFQLKKPAEQNSKEALINLKMIYNAVNIRKPIRNC